MAAFDSGSCTEPLISIAVCPGSAMNRSTNCIAWTTQSRKCPFHGCAISPPPGNDPLSRGVSLRPKANACFTDTAIGLEWELAGVSRHFHFGQTTCPRQTDTRTHVDGFGKRAQLHSSIMSSVDASICVAVSRQFCAGSRKCLFHGCGFQEQPFNDPLFYSQPGRAPGWRCFTMRTFVTADLSPNFT